MHETKICSRCFEQKPLTEYRQDKRKPNVRLSFCRTCYNKQCSAWNKKNRERVRANQVRWLDENRDRWNAYVKQWRETTREIRIPKQHAWRLTYRQRERELERARYWADVEQSRKRRRDRARLAYQADTEASRAKARTRYARRPDYYKALVHSYRVRRSGGTGRYEGAAIFVIYRAQRGRCAYCPKRLGKFFYCVDHIQPVSKGGSNDRRNLQLTCRSCNSRKGAKDPIVFAQSLGRLL